MANQESMGEAAYVNAQRNKTSINEDLIAVGIPRGMELSGEGHLFQQLHGKDPYVQLKALEKVGLGSQEYKLVTIK